MPDIDTIEQIKEVINVTIPKMYKVLLHNDDSTTFDFVIEILVVVFHRSLDESTEIAGHIHLQGQGVAGAPYTREVAEEKIHEVTLLSRSNGFPLTATFEEI